MITHIKIILQAIYQDFSALSRKGLAKEIPSTTPSKYSIVKEIGVNHRTVEEYIKLFNDMFLTLTLHFIDVNTGYFNYRKQIKIHFIDPLFYDVVSFWN
jgi:predicted AAA+ superfamily ATPase